MADEYEQFFEADRASAANGAVLSLNDDPDKAARAQDLGNATGTSPALIYPDVEGFENGQKALVTKALFDQNRFLRDYAASHPMAAKVSNDDWGQLDKISTSPIIMRDNSMLAGAIRGFAEGFGPGGLGSWIKPEDWEKHRLAASTWSVIAGPVEGVMRFGSGAISALARAGENAAKQVGVDPDIAQKQSDYFIHAAGDPGLWASLGPVGEALGTPFMIAAHNAALREMTKIEPYVRDGKVPPPGVSPIVDGLHVEQAEVDAKNLQSALKEATASTTRERSPELFQNFMTHVVGDQQIGISADAALRLYGIEPPTQSGMTRVYHSGSAGIGDFGRWVSTNRKYAADYRSDLPLFYRDLAEGDPRVNNPDWPDQGVKQGFTFNFELSPEEATGLKQISREKNIAALIKPDDGLLGWVPGIKDQLEVAAGTGADIKVPLADWLAKVDPAVAKELQDHVRARPEGMTVEEAKVPIEYGEESPVPSATEDVRQTAKFRQPVQLELPIEGTTNLADREAFAKANAIGMTVDQYNRYQKLIERQAEEDAAASAKRALTNERKRQTAEWKANEREVRSQVADEIAARPEHELDEALRDGTVRLRSDTLTPEQKAALPPEWIGREGIHPDDLARLYDAPSAEGVINSLIDLVHQREQSGMRPLDFRRAMISAEVDRQMELRYGNLDKNIVAEAMDQVLTNTQLDMLHEETLALAAKANAEFSITKDQLLEWVYTNFNNLRTKDADADRFLADAGRAGRAAEMGLLKGDPTEAFRQKQRQYMATIMAKEARKFAKTQDQFARFAKRHSARELESTAQDYMDWIHNIMLRVGQPVKRSVQDLEAALGRGGETGQKTLVDFVDYKQRHDLRELPVAEFLLDQNFKADPKEMTVEQFRQLNDSLQALAKNGRDEKSVYKAGERADFEAVRDGMMESLERFDKAERDLKGRKKEIAGAVRRPLRSFVAAHLQIETILNRLDRWDPRGVWTQYLFRPLAEAANHEAKLERKYSAMLKEAADTADMRQLIPNSPFQIPRSDTAAEMTRKNLRSVILNMGNESNFNKLAAGYLRVEEGKGGESLAIFKNQIREWTNRYATKEDWDWAQRIWDIFAEVKKESDEMYRNLVGIEPESLPIKPVQTPHGEYAGGYYPLIRNEFYGENLKFDKADLEGQGYIRATTAAGYTKQRTGAIYPLELDLDAMPGRLKQVIHDIAYRPAVIQAGKFVYDKKLMAELKDRLGPEQANLFQPWLKDIANQQNFMVSKDMAGLVRFANFIRQNVVSTLVGLNPSTFMKHTPTAMVSSLAEVGAKNFMNELKSLTFINEEYGQTNWAYAMQTSEELQRRHRNWRETLTGSMDQLEGKSGLDALRSGEYASSYLSLRNSVQSFSAKPVALGDLFSAVPTWLAKYKAEMEAHGVHGDAVFAADKAVRQAHGSTAMPSRSAVSRAPALSWFTGFFTFFNDLLNRQIETLWKAGEIKGMVKDGEYAEAMRMGRHVAARLTAYVIMPALIEELVTPLASDHGESWGKKAAKGLMFTLGSSWVGVRDIVNAALNGRDPSAGLVTSLYKSSTDIIRDLNAKRGTKPENIIKHGAQLSGFLTGIPPAQVGRTAAGIERYMADQEKPKGPWGWLVLGRYGTTKNHSQTFEDFLKHH